MLKVDQCAPGRRATATLTVHEADTARALGSGDVDVLGTPRLLALVEEAAVRSLDECLPAAQTSVSSWAEIEHRAPSHIGTVVTAEAVLLGVHGRRLEFSVTVTAHGVEVAHCRHRRVLVDRARFSAPG